MSPPRVLIYLLRRDLRVADNPVLHALATAHSQAPFTHLLPLYVFAPPQIETSGFLRAPDATPHPYPAARSTVGGFWRCGRRRAQFVAESVWGAHDALRAAGSGLCVRVGTAREVLQGLLEGYRGERGEVVGVWMTGEEAVEERREEREVRAVVEGAGKEFRLWRDEKYFVDDRDLPFKNIKDLPDLFTSYRKMVEPLRECPRKVLPAPSKLPPLPDFVPEQATPFAAPTSLDDTLAGLFKPLDAQPDLPDPPAWPAGATTAHPFTGGADAAHARVRHLLEGGHMTRYKDTRNGMLGADFSTKLSAWLALGCISARQVHESLLHFEDGRGDVGKGAQGYGKGENKGTGWVRFELLWRDYMRLLARKHRQRLFRLTGFADDTRYAWASPARDPAAKEKWDRFAQGTTGMGLVDASQRELALTGYSSNRARQNVGSFLGRHLGLDWRLGAEWYESRLVDYDVASNWGNWQSVAISERVFNPVKQGFDYDKEGAYVKMWVAELRGVQGPEGVFQAWKVPQEEKERLGLVGTEIAERPLKRIEYRPGKGGGGGGGPGGKKRGKGPKGRKH